MLSNKQASCNGKVSLELGLEIEFVNLNQTDIKNSAVVLSRQSQIVLNKHLPPTQAILLVYLKEKKIMSDK